MRKILLIFMCILLFIISLFTNAFSADDAEVNIKLEKLVSGQFSPQPSLGGGNNFSAVSELIDVNKYILGPGDVFSVYVTGKSNLSYQAVVYPDGNIYIPVIGAVFTKGKTVNQLRYILQREFLKYYLPPLYFNIVVNSLKLIKVNVIGQVNSPGMYEIVDGSTQTKRLINFLRAAGGFNSYADYDNIEVIRDEYNRSKKHLISFTDINDGIITQNIVLRSGDTVFVPKRINTIYVLGEVNVPGAYNYTSKSTILDFIAQAGGLSKSAADTIRIIRREENGDNKIIKTNLKSLLKKGEYTNLELIKPKDIVFVGKSYSFGNFWSGVLGAMNLFKYSLTVPRDAIDAWIDLKRKTRSPVTQTGQ